MQIKYSVIIPCYNEALNLTKLIEFILMDDSGYCIQNRNIIFE